MSWTVYKKTIEDVRMSIDKHLRMAPIPSFAKVGWERDELFVQIDKGGRSEFRVALKEDGCNIQILEVKRDVAFFHKPFLSTVESLVSQLMKDVGANKC